MRENETKREELKASLQHFAINKKSLLYSVLSGAFIAKPHFQITKITRRIIITGGQIGKKIKK